jgi:hypothetical protein
MSDPSFGGAPGLPNYPPPKYGAYLGGSPTPAPRQTPDHIKFATKLMTVGAGVKLVAGIVMLAMLPADHHSSYADGILLGSWIGAGLWFWMASGIRNGGNWARITGTVFFGLASLGLLVDLAILSSLNVNHAAVVPGAVAAVVTGIAFDLLNWGIGLYVMILIWQKRSTGFFRPQMYGAPPYPYGVPGQVPPTGYPPYQGGWPITPDAPQPPEPPSA